MNPAAELRTKAQARWPGATVAERRRKSIRHRHPTEPHRFMLDASIGPIHYGPAADQEIDTAWQESAGEWDYEVTANDFHCFVRDSVPVSYRFYQPGRGHYVELTFSAVEWVNDEGQSEPAASFSQVTPAIDDDRITWSEIAPGWSATIHAQTARLAKLINITSLADLGSPATGGTNERLRISITFQKSTGLEVWADGVQWGEKNNTWIETAADIEFRDETTQEPVFWFRRPWAQDSSADEAIIAQRARKLGTNYQAEIDIPWSWLQAAVFPITIDPTIDEDIGAGADDGYTEATAETFQIATAGVRVGNYDSVSYTDMDAWFRFSGISGLGGTTITTSFLTFVTLRVDAGVLCNIYADDAEAPAAPSDYADHRGRTRTAAFAAWDGETNTGTINTPSINPVIQELVDSYDPSSILFLIDNDGSTNDDRYKLTSYDNNPGNAAGLHIEYSAGGSPWSIYAQQ